MGRGEIMHLIRFSLVFASLAALAAPVFGQQAPDTFPRAGNNTAAPKTSGGANLGSAQLYAFVNADGTVDAAKSKGTVPCPAGNCRVQPGHYVVEFVRPIQNCTIQATAYFSPRVAVAQWGTSSVLVGVTQNAVGTDSPVHILVIC
jgi:hypothetical protein